MAQVSTQQFNVSHIMIGLFAMMVAAGAFVVIVTQMLITSHVQAAYQNNPVTVTPAAQTNNAPAAACVEASVSAAVSEGHVLGSSTGQGGTPISDIATRAISHRYHPLGSLTYNQSNTSTTTTTSTNTFVKDSYNTSTVTRDNGNTDSRFSNNTANVALTDSRDQSSTTTTNTSTNTTSTSTVIRDNGNTDNQNVGNTNNTDNSQDNSNSSTNVNVVDQSDDDFVDVL